MSLFQRPAIDCDSLQVVYLPQQGLSHLLSDEVGIPDRLLGIQADSQIKPDLIADLSGPYPGNPFHSFYFLDDSSDFLAKSSVY